LQGMFYGCSSLSDVKPLEKWKVPKGNKVRGMFCGCSSIFDFTALEKWNVSESLLKNKN
jgi:hypothetical protein